MPLIIDRQPATNVWCYPDVEEGAALTPELVSGQSVVVVPERLEEASVLSPERLGVQLQGEADLEVLQNWWSRLSLVVVEFPVFTDGRGFSLARQIRRLGYQGELRARGDLGRDRLAFLERCGFNAFELAQAPLDPAVLDAFAEISVRYQGSADDPRPIYRQPGVGDAS